MLFFFFFLAGVNKFYLHVLRSSRLDLIMSVVYVEFEYSRSAYPTGGVTLSAGLADRGPYQGKPGGIRQISHPG